MNFPWMVHNNDLSSEVFGSFWRIVFAIPSNIPTLNILYRNVLNVKANIVSRQSLCKGFMVHFHRFDLCGKDLRSKSNNCPRLKDSSLHTSHRNCSDTSNFVHILQGQTQRLIGGSFRGQNTIQGLKQSFSTGISFLTFNSPSLEPWHICTFLHHIVSMPTRYGNKGNSFRIVTNFFYISTNFLFDLLKALLTVGWFSTVYLVYTNNKLLDSQCES
mmetsp:Transcript_4996/g.8338  ORF Transcript_4996/g.8338 Transcript_4996/m.8338 type:complete len:216 (+) Transcript_4996:557-1204(+)